VQELQRVDGQDGAGAGHILLRLLENLRRARAAVAQVGDGQGQQPQRAGSRARVHQMHREVDQADGLQGGVVRAAKGSGDCHHDHGAGVGGIPGALEHGGELVRCGL